MGNPNFLHNGPALPDNVIYALAVINVLRRIATRSIQTFSCKKQIVKNRNNKNNNNKSEIDSFISLCQEFFKPVDRQRTTTPLLFPRVLPYNFLSFSLSLPLPISLSLSPVTTN